MPETKKPLTENETLLPQPNLNHLSLALDDLTVAPLETRLSLIFCDVGGCYLPAGHRPDIGHDCLQYCG